ncbi:MAG: aromatic acid exporter family protein [Actinomycetota bacterium]|nr:aromatic acid exporter family protein [Actinomycetota bacterium]
MEPPLGLGRRQLRWRSRLRHALWWLWPSWPTTWSEVPARLRAGLAQIARLTAAAVVSYVTANRFSPGIVDLTAPLTALLVVQASTVGTLQMGLVRVGAVLTGVLVAVGVASSIGLTWWSLAIVIATSLTLAKILRLGEQSLEAPISAMLILAVSSPELAAEVRMVNTLIGAVVGIAFSLLVPVTIPNARARGAVRAVARSQAGLLSEVALSVASRTPHPEEVTAWLTWAEHIDRDIDAAASSVEAVEQGRKLNPLALASATVHHGLADALSRLERCLAAVRALLSVIALQVPPIGDAAERPVAVELRRAFAAVLDDLASGLRSFADLIDAEYGQGPAERVDEALGRTLEVVRESRAVVTELMLIDVDPRQHADLWMLQGSVLAAVEHVLRQLDLEHTGHRSEPWLRRRAAPLFPQTWQAVRRSLQRWP